MRFHLRIFAAAFLLLGAVPGCTAVRPPDLPSPSPTPDPGSARLDLPLNSTPFSPLLPSTGSGAGSSEAGLTFDEGLSAARPVVEMWSPQAALIRARPLPPGETSEAPPAYGAGRAARWLYEFRDPSGEIDSGLRVVVGAGGYERSELLSLSLDVASLNGETNTPDATTSPVPGEILRQVDRRPVTEPVPAAPPGPISALEAYELASEAVSATSPEAQLTLLASLPAGVDLGGLASAWRLRFSGTNESGKTVQYLVEAGAGGHTSLQVFPSLVDAFLIQTYEDWLIDSQTALAIAEALGGAGFRQRYPDARVEAALWWTNLDASHQPVPSYTPRWEVRYSSQAGQARKSFLFSGAWGDQPEIHSRYQPAAWEGLTASQAAPAAESFVHERLPGHALVSVNAPGGLSAEGKAESWQFIYTPSEGQPAGALGYLVEVGALGIESLLPVPAGAESAPGLVPADTWVTGSRAAGAICEAAAGAELSARNPGLAVNAALFLGEEPGMPEGANPPLWRLTYTLPDSQETLTCWVDARRGELVEPGS